MPVTKKPGAGPELRSGPLITAAALFGAGTLLTLAGLAVGGSHLMSAARRWIKEMEVTPGELAKMKLAQAKVAAAAGASAWQNEHPAATGRR